ncbi:MAG TPA: CaiB/BaiF CoA-transferase family protein [SAR202 cluster bacterium]|nr:CaiB/BaiF CoA-transferase family protein [SAR202 cluster bacterium]
MTLAFEGVRMIDFTQIEQGPAGTQVLADFGADVIKVERIDVGEMGRTKPDLNGVGLFFMANNRNKRSISIDIRTPEGKEIIYKMAETSDIVASNFRPGVMDRIGFGFDKFQEINQRIIWAVASGYGQTGPYEKRAGQDLLAQALGGLIAMTGERDAPPTTAGTWIADYLGAMMLAQGIMIALAAREHTGRGQIVDTNLLNGMIASHIQENAVVLNSDLRYPRSERGGGHSGAGPLYGVYECNDGNYYALMGGFINDSLSRVSDALDIQPSLDVDPQFKDVDLRSGYSAELRAALEKAFKKFTRSEVEERFDRVNLPPGSVYDIEEMFEDPQVVHNDMIVETEHPVYGLVKLTGFPMKLSDTPATMRIAPPTVGEHNEEVLGELGYSEGQIRDLQTAGVVGSENIKREKETAAAD